MRNDKLQGLMIGYGFIAGGHLKAMQSVHGMEIAGVLDVSASRRAAARRDLREVEVYSGWPDDLSMFDFVDVCTPPMSHAGYMEKCRTVGIPALVEKPLVIPSSPLSDDLLRDDTCFVYPAQNYLHAPILAQLRSEVPRVSSGLPVRGYFRTLRRGHARGVADWKPDWRRQNDIAGGGILWDHGPHSFYLAEETLGATIQRLRCSLGFFDLDPQLGSESYAFVELQLSDGSRVVVELDWNSQVRQTSYSFWGERGHVRVVNDDLHSSRDGYATRNVMESAFDDASHSAWFVDVLSEFRDEVLGVSGSAKRATLFSQACRVVKAISLAYASAASGGVWVSLGDDAIVTSGHAVD